MPVLFSGLSQIKKLHCHPGTKAKYCKRLLGDGVVGKFVNYRHVVQMR